MKKRRFLIFLIVFLLFFLGSVNYGVKGAFTPVNGGGGGCVDRGESCDTTSDCCGGYCETNPCQCESSVCCHLTGTLNRGETCYCEGECRSALTCTMSIDGHKECCDERTTYKRDAGEVCYCNVECKSGQCIGGVCAGIDTCSPAGCACVPTPRDCERLFGGIPTSSLDCPDPSYVCCCEEEPAPEPEPENCPSPCYCTRTGCGGPVIGPCDGSLEWFCCCPAPEPTPPVCGNGVIESGEQCDDGNTVSGDGCSATCTSEDGDENGEDNGDGNWVIGGDGGIISLQSPLGCTTIEECIGRIINFVFSLAVILAPLMIILAGFLYITAAGNPEKVAQAKKLITWTLIGFLIVTLARAMVYVIQSVIGG